METVKVKRNPQLIVKWLRGQVGSLNAESTELFILDDLASRVLMRVTKKADPVQLEELSPEERTVVEYLLDARILIETKQ